MAQITKIDVASAIQSTIDELNLKPSTLNTEQLIKDLLNIRSLSYGASAESVVETLKTKIRAISIDKKMFDKHVPVELNHTSELFDERQANLQQVLEKINK